MPNEAVWLTADDAIEFNRLAVEQTSEPFFVRDRSLLEGAMASPRNHWHYGESRLPVLAAHMLLALARDHPFEQGNKRVALLAADAFLAANGFDLQYPDVGFEALIVGAIARTISQPTFVEEFAASVAQIQVPNRRPKRLRNSKRFLGNRSFAQRRADAKAKRTKRKR
ncbi:Fic family protein [Sphingomonas faeni]|uniref:Fic family protein n=1 Tax=Sphingomonas faeni TaxID=185950 RepID=UPI003D68F410